MPILHFFKDLLINITTTPGQQINQAILSGVCQLARSEKRLRHVLRQ